MRTFSFETVWPELLTPDIVAMLSQIHEYKGEQTLFIAAKADTLTQLMDLAKIQSTEASNKIEGIFTSDERMKRIVQSKAIPHTRSEQEIAGYRDVLATIHESHDYIPPKPSVILQLHRDLYRYSGTGRGGQYKISDNVIAEEDAQGNKSVRFQPVSAWETPETMNALCAAYEKGIAEEQADALLLMPIFILDFLCIHPFDDGNGRMSRLLTLLLLYRSGYIVGKYISIEQLIEQSKTTYYDALLESSVGWHDNKNDYRPFVRYMLGIILRAYRDFTDRVQVLAAKNLSKPQRVREVIRGTLGKITKAELMAQCPNISQVTIQRVLGELLKSGDIIKIGGGRYTAYTWNRERE